MSTYQKIRLRLWTAWHYVLDLVAAAALSTKRFVTSLVKTDTWRLAIVTAAIAPARTIRAVWSWAKRAFTEVVRLFTNPYAAGFVVLIALTSMVLAARVTADRYRPVLAKAHNDVAALEKAIDVQRQRIYELSDERSRLSAELVSLKTELAAAKAPAPAAPVKVVYRNRKMTVTRCHSNCILGWSF